MTRVQFPVAEPFAWCVRQVEAFQRIWESSCQAVIAQLGERQTEDLEVLGSIPSPGMRFAADGQCT